MSLPRPVKPKRPRLPLQVPPTRIEEAYAGTLVRMIGRLRAAWAPVLRALPELVESAAAERGDAFDPEQPRDEHGRWGSGGGHTEAVPRTKAAAAGEIAARVHEQAQARPGYPGLEKVQKNWAKQLDTKGIPKEAFAEVDRAIAANASNPTYAAIREHVGIPDGVVLVNPGFGRGSNGEGGNRDVGTHTTILYYRGERTAPEALRPGVAQIPGREAMLRHEYGHDVYERHVDNNPTRREQWAALRADIGHDRDRAEVGTTHLGDRTAPVNEISRYASVNEHELFAESFALVTDPGYRPADYSPRVRGYLSGFQTMIGVPPGLRRDAERLDAPSGKKLKALVDHAVALGRAAIHPTEVEAVARKIAKRTTDYQKVQLARQAKAATGVDPVFKDAGMTARVDQFAAENVALVTRIPERLHGDLHAIVTRALSTGRRTANRGKSDSIAKEIEARFGVAEKHARLIARDQVLKLHAKVNHHRQKELGVKRFVWRTVGDERVRGDPAGKYPRAEPSHYELDGEEFSHHDPETPIGDDGEPLMPGLDFQCRCTAEPVFDF